MSAVVIEDIAIDVVAPPGAAIAESLLWVPDEGALYWADIKAPALYRLDGRSGQRATWKLPAEIGAFALLDRAAAAVVALRDGLFRLDLTGGELDLLAPPPFDPALFRFNEGIVDPAGRFWVGAMFDPLTDPDQPRQKGALHSFTGAGGLVPHDDRAKIHNGMALGRDGRSLFIAHSESGTIQRYPLDLGNGVLGDPKDFARVDPAVGQPDGAAMDAEGFYWSAIHGGSRLRRYTPAGDLDREIALPVTQPTMCCFGGDNLATLYVSSAADGLSDAKRQREPLAGAVLSLRPGVAGHPKPVYCR